MFSTLPILLNADKISQIKHVVQAPISCFLIQKQKKYAYLG